MKTQGAARQDSDRQPNTPASHRREPDAHLYIAESWLRVLSISIASV
jgi:hypothetical protein